MPRTILTTADPKTVQRYSKSLSYDVVKQSYWTKRLSATGTKAAPMRILTDLESGPGDKITFELAMQIRTQPVIGEQEKMAGKETNLLFYSDEIKIDEAMIGINVGGKMTRKRANHDYRKTSKSNQKDWWARYFDELSFAYASGAVSTGTGQIVTSADHAMFAVNPLQTADADHTMYGGTATSKAALTASDQMTLDIVERAHVKAVTMGGDGSENASLDPVPIEGEDNYVMVMHEYQAHALRRQSGGDWLEINKALTTAEGKNSPIFKNAIGVHKGVILHAHRNCVLENVGAGSAVEGGVALFMGNQALQCAYGTEGKDSMYQWHEELDDRGREVVMNSSTTFGIKKTQFNGRDKGLITIHTAAKNPL